MIVIVNLRVLEVADEVWGCLAAAVPDIDCLVAIFDSGVFLMAEACANGCIA